MIDPLAAIPEVSVVMPCLNEEETLGICLKKARDTIERLGLTAEIVVADNGSTDRSVEIARSFGARVVHESRKGYGSAYLAGFAAARGHFIVMADSDDSYDWTEMGRFLEPLRQGADFVIGTRLRGHIDPGAMPWLHRYVGNPVLTGTLNVLFGAGISDAHCGMRAFTRDALDRMHLRTTGMEFASEMVIKAAKAGLRTIEIPITLHKDKRSRPPHLRTWRDGWRHLRFMLLLSSTWLYMIPGLVLCGLGLVPLVVLYPGPIHLGHVEIDVHTMILGSLLMILGVQILTTGLFARVYSFEQEFDQGDRLLRALARHFNLERGLLLGLSVFLVGLAIDAHVLITWIRQGLGPLAELRPAILGSTLLAVGVQIITASFFLSMLSVKVADLSPKKER
jgi:glycosyltransferase involved in cell wall biosynthesis